MGDFLFLVNEPADKSFSDVVDEARGSQDKWVRRPLWGLEIRRDTYAGIRVFRRGSGEVKDGFHPVIDSSSRTALSTTNTNFSLSRVQILRGEKKQLIETFGPFYVFFYGDRPTILNVQATLLDTPDFPWVAEWWANYELYLRGTRCVENDARVVLSYKDVVVEGYIMEAQTNHVADNDHMAMLTFSMVLTNYVNLIVNASQPGALALSPPQGSEGEWAQTGPKDFWREVKLDMATAGFRALSGLSSGATPAEKASFNTLVVDTQDTGAAQILGLEVLLNGHGGVATPSGGDD